MSVSADILRRIARLRLSPEASEEILNIIADLQEAADDRKAKQRERTSRYRMMCDPVADDVRATVIARDGMVCRYCGDAVTVAHLDHVLPVSRGGRSEADNLAVACKPCNSSKRDRTLSEWGGSCR